MAERIKLLFLTASPEDWEKVSSDPELRDITAEIAASLDRDKFEIASAFAVRTGDLIRTMLDQRPTIVHFSGHGKSGRILLEDNQRKAVAVPSGAFARLFENPRSTVRIVFLDACETDETAQALEQVVDYTIAMSRQIADEAALSFARAFYIALASGDDVPSAFKLGIIQMGLDGQSTETDIPRMYSREPDRPRAVVAPPEKPALGQSQVDVYKSTTGNIFVVNGSNVVIKD